jgi:molecular chaperone DnaJ
VKRFRRRGVPHPEGRGRGDLLVEIAVQTPTHLGEQQRALLRQLAQLRGEEVDPHAGGLFARLKGGGR